MSTKNKLSDLNDHLFVQLERLNSDSLSLEDLEIETKRAKAVSDIAKQIVGSAKLTLDAARYVAHGEMDTKDVPTILIGSKNQNS